MDAQGCIGWKVTFRPELREGVEADAWLEATLDAGRISVRHAATIEVLGGNGASVSGSTGEFALEDAVANEDGTVSVSVPVAASAANAQSQFFCLDVE